MDKYSTTGEHLWTLPLSTEQHLITAQFTANHLQLWLRDTQKEQLNTVQIDPVGQMGNYLTAPIQLDTSIRNLQNLTTDSKHQIILTTHDQLSKYRPTGELLWTQTIPNLSYQATLEIDARDNIYLTTNGPTTQLYKYSPDGQLLWSKLSEPTYSEPNMSHYSDIADVATNPTTNTVQIMGITKNRPEEATFFTPPNTLFTFRFTDSGEITWHQTFPIKPVFSQSAMETDSASNTYIAGTNAWRFKQFPTFYLKKYGPSGQLIWNRHRINLLLPIVLLYYLLFIFFEIKNGQDDWLLRVLGITLVFGLTCIVFFI